MIQTQEQDKTLENKLNKTELRNLADKEFKLMVIGTQQT